MINSTMLLYTNQYGGYGFTGAYTQPKYKNCRQVNFYYTGAWIIDWTRGSDRDEWIHTPDRMRTAWESGQNPTSDVIAYDWEARPYPDEGIKIEHAMVDGENRFIREAACFRYNNMVEEMTDHNMQSLVYGLPPLWNMDRHNPDNYTPDSPVWKVLETVDIWAPVIYFRTWANTAQLTNLRRLVAFRDQYFPNKKICPHISPYNSSNGVADMERFSVVKFKHHQVRKAKECGADGAIYWDMLHKLYDHDTADAMTEPFLDALSDWDNI